MGMTNTPAACIFCQIASGEAPARVIREWPDVIAFAPRHPVTPGHVMVVPRQHVADFIENPMVTARVMQCAAELGQRPMNLITSAGSEATQTVFHLHVHLVPRSEGDGLTLPWTGQVKS